MGSENSPGSSSNKAEALSAIGQLAADNNLSAAEIYSYLVPESEPESGRSILTRVLGYIGGLFVLAGIMAFVVLQWENLSSSLRVLITLGTGSAVFVCALMFRRRRRFPLLIMPALVIGSLLQATGIMVAFSEYGSGGDAEVAALITCILLTVQLLFTRLLKTEPTVAWLTAFFASMAWGFGLDLMGVELAVIGLTLGIAWLAAGALSQRSYHILFAEQFFLIGSWAVMASVFDLVAGHWYELIFLPVACALVFIGIWLRSRTLNFASSAGLLLFAAYFTGEHFADSIGWPLALILIGLLMLGISTLALRIDRKYLRA